MIAPRATRLVRVPHLPAFRDVTAALAVGGGLAATRARIVLVPTRGAARQLRATIENRAAQPVVVLPDFATRDQLYDLLHARLADPPRRLSPFDREAMMRAAARAAAAGAPPPFPLRPGLVAEIVRFYDQLRRQGQSVARFEELLADALERDAELDRGAARMLAQTRFLAATYRAYERRMAECGALDEHALRDRLVRDAAPAPVAHVVVSIADWIADPDGLFQADFDLLTRVPGLRSIDVVATERLLASGFHERVHEWLPGLEEVDGGERCSIETRESAVLAVPPEPGPGPVFVSRDREEELAAAARRLKVRGRVEQDPPDLDRVAVVFRRPLPYLYLVRGVFGAAGIPYQIVDALPLAAEPIGAALDLAIEAASSQFSRASLIGLLRSPHFDLTRGGEPVSPGAVAALDRALSEARYLGELERLRQLASEWEATGDGRRTPVRAALAAALTAAAELGGLLEPAPASVHLRRLAAFLEAFGRPLPPGDPLSARQLRAQAALLGALRGLAAARAAWDDEPATIDELAPDIRRSVEEETFAPAPGGRGVHLLDAQAARYGDFEEVTIVGLVEGEWPERPRRNIFYPPSLLAALGWPSEKERRGAAGAAFLDLLSSASSRVALSTFTLDDEALVERSSLIEEASAAGLPIALEPPLPPVRVFADEALSLPPVALDALDPLARRWAELRLARTDAADARYHGAAGPQPARPLPVSAVETYLSCPFKFFAGRVLRLEEEPDDEEVMDPKRRGQFVHAVFESFFGEWQARGRRAITPDTLDAARALFADLVERHLAPLPEAEAALERTRLLGSPVAAGLGEVVFRMEAERPGEVVERLLEFNLDGEFDFDGPDGPRRIALRGVADRIDLLADGTMRLVDYKLSSAPRRARALQLPIYGLCAEQRLRARADGPWRLGEAAYIAFRGGGRVAPLFTPRAGRDEVLAAAQARLIAAVDGIEAGAFPPTPSDVFLCGSCSYAAVCRKEYVGDV